MEQIKVNFKKKGLSLEADKEQVAMAVKTWRLRHDLTQEEMGTRWGMSRYTILRIEGAKNISWEMAYKAFAHLSEELSKEKGGSI